MRGVETRTRREWIHRIIGSDGNLTAIKFDRVIRIRKLDGWRTAMPAEGSMLEQVAFVHDSHPGAQIIAAYISGQRWFGIAGMEAIIGRPLHTPIAVLRLSQLGLAMASHDPEKEAVELRAAAPNEARYVNKARAGGGMGGNAHRVVNAFLHVRLPRFAKPPGFYVTRRRCRAAARVMKSNWGIECSDLLLQKKRVMFRSDWLLPGVPEGAPVRFKPEGTICLGRRTLPDGSQKCGVWWEEQEFGM